MCLCRDRFPIINLNAIKEVESVEQVHFTLHSIHKLKMEKSKMLNESRNYIYININYYDVYFSFLFHCCLLPIHHISISFREKKTPE